MDYHAIGLVPGTSIAAGQHVLTLSANGTRRGGGGNKLYRRPTLGEKSDDGIANFSWPLTDSVIPVGHTFPVFIIKFSVCRPPFSAGGCGFLRISGRHCRSGNTN